MVERAVQARQTAQSRLAGVGRRRSGKHASDTWIATEGGTPRMESNLTELDPFLLRVATHHSCLTLSIRFYAVFSETVLLHKRTAVAARKEILN